VDTGFGILGRHQGHVPGLPHAARKVRRIPPNGSCTRGGHDGGGSQGLHPFPVPNLHQLQPVVVVVAVVQVRDFGQPETGVRRGILGEPLWRPAAQVRRRKG
jgi:hypothetical protein